jgi:hypothetical protein
VTTSILPDGVSKKATPGFQFFTQRIDGRPFVNCMAYSGASLVEFGGLDVPDTFGMTIRRASGVPIGPHRGMSVADVRRGLLKLIPWARLLGSRKSETDFLELVASGQDVAVMINFEKVPQEVRLRDFVGSYTGGHSAVITGTRVYRGNRQVRLFDPMAPSGHAGRWYRWSNVMPYLYKDDGLIRHFYIEKGQLLTDFPSPELIALRAEIERLSGELTDKTSELAGVNNLLTMATEGMNRLGAELDKHRTLTAVVANEVRASGTALLALADRLDAIARGETNV